jgi:hypothetical protein
MKKMIDIFDTVRLKRDLVNVRGSGRKLINLPTGSFGTVVMVYDERVGDHNKPIAYEVDFCDSTGDTIALLTLDSDDIKLYRRYKTKKVS